MSQDKQTSNLHKSAEDDVLKRMLNTPPTKKEKAQKKERPAK